MQASHTKKIVAVLSRARWAPYTVDDVTDEIATARYIWNIALCQALYPSLHVFEIALRNRIFAAGENHLAFARCVDIRCWLDADPPILKANEAAAVRDAKRWLFADLQRKHGPSRWRPHVSPDGLVAKLSLGFWECLLGRQYGSSVTMPGILWPRLLRSVFPSLPRGTQRAQIESRVEAIRKLRNRIFHHEPIWSDPELASTHASLVEVCSWLSPHLHAHLVAFDTFTSLNRASVERYLRRRVKALF